MRQRFDDPRSPFLSKEQQQSPSDNAKSMTNIVRTIYFAPGVFLPVDQLRLQSKSSAGLLPAGLLLATVKIVRRNLRPIEVLDKSD